MTMEPLWLRRPMNNLVANEILNKDASYRLLMSRVLLLYVFIAQLSCNKCMKATFSKTEGIEMTTVRTS